MKTKDELTGKDIQDLRDALAALPYEELLMGTVPADALKRVEKEVLVTYTEHPEDAWKFRVYGMFPTDHEPDLAVASAYLMSKAVECLPALLDTVEEYWSSQ